MTNVDEDGILTIPPPPPPPPPPPTEDTGNDQRLPDRQAFEIFADVSEDAYYEAAVTWMIRNSVTVGCSDGAFCPDEPVTRRQFVTFLWRAAGSPEPDQAGSDTFSDVTTGDYADKAIGWAAEREITAGCAPAEFCPGDTTTRAQAAAFIHRYHTSTAPNPELRPQG